jgi:NAD(P) transhydrogenase subunit alpha
VATRVALSDDQHEREQELIGRHVAESDAVITTALIPGAPRPSSSPPTRRGGCGGLRDRRPRGRSGRELRAHAPGETVTDDGVTIVASSTSERDAAARDQMYSRNVWTFLNHLLGGGSELTLDFEDEITRETVRDTRGQGAQGARGLMTMTLLNSITVFVLAVFIGIEIISKVPTMLHTPLMSGTNAIHGIVLVGAMLIAGSADSDLEKALAFVAVVFATINVVGGFLVTDRMLEMFKRKPVEAGVRVTPLLALSQTAINFTYLVAAVLLIVGIRRLSSPPTARSGKLDRRGGDGDRDLLHVPRPRPHELLADLRRHGRRER